MDETHIEIPVEPEIVEILQTISLELDMNLPEIVTISLIYGALLAFKE